MKKNKSARRTSALERLKTQLKAGTKTLKHTTNKTAALSDTDKTRISKEIETLSTRSKN